MSLFAIDASLGLTSARYSNILYYAAAAATAIAGILHLTMGPGSLGFNAGQGILFTVGGIAQIFWIIPMIRKWGAPWYAIGIAGTVVLIALWVITRMPANPITGRGGPTGSPTAILIEVSQVVFIALAAAVLAYEVRAKKKAAASTAEKALRGKSRIAILVAIVVALVLVGAFVLPMVMPRGPGGGGPRPGGAPRLPQPSPTDVQQGQLLWQV